jgi:hypothetical protein
LIQFPFSFSVLEERQNSRMAESAASYEEQKKRCLQLGGLCSQIVELLRVLCSVEFWLFICNTHSHHHTQTTHTNTYTLSHRCLELEGLLIEKARDTANLNVEVRGLEKKLDVLLFVCVCACLHHATQMQKSEKLFEIFLLTHGSFSQEKEQDVERTESMLKMMKEREAERERERKRERERERARASECDQDRIVESLRKELRERDREEREREREREDNEEQQQLHTAVLLAEKEKRVEELLQVQDSFVLLCILTCT